MISDWLSANGQVAIKKIGLPPWMGGEAGFRRHLDFATIRDRARAWLEENTDGWSGGLSSGGYSIETYDADSNEWTLHSTPQSDWDGCLILAILGTENA